MNYTGNIYRPPFEARSLLLQVTVGCSHNACRFCSMYKDVSFSMEPMERIEADLREAAQLWPQTRRVFLENGDPFVLSAGRLGQIAERIYEHLPRVETIAMYASIQNIRTKTDEDLSMLRTWGINELNIGVESGLDDALTRMNKGYTAAEAERELLRLKKAGIDFGLNVIFGIAGAGWGLKNAAVTAELVNRTQPYLLFTGTMHADQSSELYKDMRTERFRECIVRELLEEEEAFLSALEMEGCHYFGLHPANVIPLQGWLPEGKNDLLTTIRKARNDMPERFLNSIPRRGGEGAILG